MPNALWTNLASLFRARTPLAKVLAGLPLFADLTTQQLEEVERIVHLRTYRAGEVIFEAGDAGVAMYVIVAGEVKIVLPDESGEKNRELARLGMGDLFGELALLDASPRSATAIATTATEAAAIARPDWMNLIERRPSIGVRMMLPLSRLLAARLRMANRPPSDSESDDAGEDTV